MILDRAAWPLLTQRLFGRDSSFTACRQYASDFPQVVMQCSNCLGSHSATDPKYPVLSYQKNGDVIFPLGDRQCTPDGLQRGNCPCSTKIQMPRPLLLHLKKGLEQLIVRRFIFLSLKHGLLRLDKRGAISQCVVVVVIPALTCDIEEAWKYGEVTEILTMDVGVTSSMKSHAIAFCSTSGSKHGRRTYWHWLLLHKWTICRSSWKTHVTCEFLSVAGCLKDIQFLQSCSCCSFSPFSFRKEILNM